MVVSGRSDVEAWRGWVRIGLVVALALLSTLMLAPAARAEFGIRGFDAQITADAGGTPYTQAAGHPYAISTTLDFNTTTKTMIVFGLPFDVPWPVEPVKDIFVDVPPGLVGNPTVVPQCTMEQLAALDSSASPFCPAESQIGIVDLRTPEPLQPDNIRVVEGYPVYNVVPPPGVPARFGFNFGGVVVALDAALRSGSDYGLSVNIRNASEGLALLGTELTLWGTPADPAHDAERWCPVSGSPGCPSSGEIKPFLTTPTACTAPGIGLAMGVRIDSWFDPGDFKSASFFTHLPPNYPDPAWPGVQQGPTGCGEVPFHAAFSAKPGSLASPGAAGYDFDLSIPQEDDPITGLAPSHVKMVTVTLPEGVRVSPSSAAGLEACSPAQIDLAGLGDPTCPEGSKIGSLRIDTPLLEEPLSGSVYLATPHDNPSRSLLGLYLVAKGPGLVVKLPGSVSPNGNTGQLSATFDNNPQLPFSQLHLEFDGGPRAPLSNPARCGSHTTHAILTSWSGKTEISDSSFTTSRDGRGGACPPPRFRPRLRAGTVNPVAGASSPFSLTLSRDDEDDELRAIDAIDMPDGLLARIADVPLCGAAAVAAGTCGEASRIGSVTTAAGPGPTPFFVGGHVYLGGSYDGAPFSLSIVVPVKAGPFDLGTVVVRSAIFIDRHTAKLKVTTDPLPTILEGIPLQVRLVNVTIDRPGFMLNPTSCAEQRIGAVAVAVTGRAARVSSRFQVGECDALELAPRLTLKVGSRGHTRRGASAPLTAVLRMPRGGANLDKVGVTLPGVLNARLPVVTNACTQAEFDAGNCEKARAGTAVASTPLLRQPLRGGAYFVKTGKKGGLPNLVVALRGQVDFDLVGAVTIPDDKFLATTFDAPDVPITKFTLRLVAGRHGPVGTTTNLCTSKARRAAARVVFRGQNGDVVRKQQRLRIAGCGRS